LVEIERKYLVTNCDFITESKENFRIVQGYLNSNPERTVRVRIKGGKGFLTIKGIGNESGMTRFEWEKEIKISEAEALLLLCEKGTIDKIRYNVIFENHLFEVDVFQGENEGLIVAEIELQSENETFSKPNWLGNEVTSDERYYNAYLSNNPFKSW
jgi:CYTH domain-containing protein